MYSEVDNDVDFEVDNDVDSEVDEGADSGENDGSNQTNQWLLSFLWWKHQVRGKGGGA